MVLASGKHTDVSFVRTESEVESDKLDAFVYD